MKKIVWLSAILLCMGAVFVMAQSGIDLSGSWVLDPSQSDNPGGMGRGRGGVDGGAPVGGPPGGRRMGAGDTGGGMPPPGGRGMGMPGGRGPGMGGASSLLIRQNGSLLNITRIMGSGDRTRTVEQNFTLDGVENTNPVLMPGGTMTATAAWTGNTLIIQGIQKMESPEGEIASNIKEELSLADEGKTLILNTTHTTPMGERTIKQVYIKQ